MATLRDIKKRITSVKSTQKITRAMKMVAAAKLRRAQAAVVGSRPYSKKLQEIVLEIVAKSDAKGHNVLFTGREKIKKVAVLVYASNRGLCGGFNSNLLRRTESFLRDLKKKGIAYDLYIIGRKGRDYFQARQYDIAETFVDWANSFPFDQAVEMTTENVQRFMAGQIDEYYLCYNQFKSAISQEITIDKLFPLSIGETKETYGIDYIYEPTKEELLESLVPKYLATQIYKAHLESLASELGARMTAMDNATNNAVDMISRLTLQYNRARQASITTELMDIVNGAEALS